MRLPLLLLPLSALSLFLASSPFSPLSPQPQLPANSLSPDAFHLAALSRVNRARAPLPPLASHPEALATLAHFAESGPPERLDHLFALYQSHHPQFQSVASHLIAATDQDSLLEGLASWPELAQPGFTHLATTLIHRPGQTSQLCLATLMRSLPALQLPAPRSAPIAAYSLCPLCQSGHSVSLDPLTHSTLLLRCPHCQSPYSLLASDTSGFWRRANHFLEGFSPFPPASGSTPEERILHLWRQVSAHCQYQTDPERLSGADTWSLPHQTHALGRGDCEDTAILLADVLLAQGFDARVALGFHDGEGHAWCVVRLGERQFILESTARGVDQLRRLPALDDLALEYHPDCLFDRDYLYFNRHQQWTSHYWSESTWRQVPSPASGHPDGSPPAT